MKKRVSSPIINQFFVFVLSQYRYKKINNYSYEKCAIGQFCKANGMSLKGLDDYICRNTMMDERKFYKEIQEKFPGYELIVKLKRHADFYYEISRGGYLNKFDTYGKLQDYIRKNYYV